MSKLKSTYETSKDTTRRGFPLLSIVFIIFLVMKLMGWGAVAGWSWWWVTAPLWGPLAVVFGLLGVVGVVSLIGLIIAGIVIGVSRIIESSKK